MRYSTFPPHGLWVLLFILLLTFSGCKTMEKPAEFVEQLRNPTSFPEIFLPTVENIDKIINENALTEDENIKIVHIGKNESTSIHLIQARQNAEMDAHYHKSHDEIVYVKQGSGILTLDDTRRNIKSGMLLIIPRRTVHKFVNTGNDLSVAISVFSPPFDGEDIKSSEKTKTTEKKVKKNIYDKGIEERKDEDDGKKWYTFWKSGEKEVDFKEEMQAQASGAVEDKKILVLTEEGKQKIKEVQQKISEEERNLIDNIILNEKLKVLQRLKDDGLISQEEYDAKRTEIIRDNNL